MGLKVFAIILIISLSYASAEEEGIKEKLVKEKRIKTQGTLEQRQKLKNELFVNYDKSINPDDLKVEYGINLVKLDVDEKKNSLEVDAWLMQTWEDSRLKWDPEEHQVEVLRIPNNLIFKPDIELYNIATNGETVCQESNVLVYSSGKVIWVPACHLSVQCPFETMKLSENPFGEQKCFLKVGSWTFDGNLMDIQFYDNKNLLIVDDYWDSSKWEIVSNTAERVVKYYDCCPEPYPHLNYNITIKRKPGTFYCAN